MYARARSHAQPINHNSQVLQILQLVQSGGDGACELVFAKVSEIQTSIYLAFEPAPRDSAPDMHEKTQWPMHGSSTITHRSCRLVRLRKDNDSLPLM